MVVNIGRKTRSPFYFSDGRHIAQGSLVFVPSLAIMTDDMIYPTSTTFNPYRFLEEKDGIPLQRSRSMHPSWDLPYWGAVGRAWLASIRIFFPTGNEERYQKLTARQPGQDLRR